MNIKNKMRHVFATAAVLAAACPANSVFCQVTELSPRIMAEFTNGRIEAKEADHQFGCHLLQSLKDQGIETNIPEDQVKRLRPGVAKISAQQEVELPQGMRFTGFLGYAYVDKVILPYGFFTFSQNGGLEREELFNPGAIPNFGGCYAGHRLLCTSSILNPTPPGSYTYYTTYNWDADTWNNITPPVRNQNQLLMKGVDIDPATGKIYGVYRTRLYELDYDAATSTEIAQLPYELDEGAAMAIYDGKGYILGKNGMFAKVDLNTLQFQVIGEIDFTLFAAHQSMTFDPRTGKLYLAASEVEDNFLYGRLCEVNLEDATTKLVGYFPENEEYLMLHVIYDPENEAPGKINDLSASYDSAALEGMLSFTLPDMTFGGTTLDGEITYSVYINDSDEPVSTGVADKGTKVNVKVTPCEGRTKYVVVLTNQHGEGERNAIESWGGEDVPDVKNIAIVPNGQNVKVSWETCGRNGGYINCEGLGYKVVRQPDGKVCSEFTNEQTVTDYLGDAPFSGYTYEITPIKGDESFEATTSDMYFDGVGRELPYSQDFETAEARHDFYTVNHHSKGWAVEPVTSMGGVLWYNPDYYLDADDWAFSPSFRMEKDMTYILSFDTFKRNENYDEVVGVAMGQGLSPDNYEAVLDSYHIISSQYDDEPDHQEIMVVCPQSGDYHIAFHALSKKNLGTFVIDNIEVVKHRNVNTPSTPTAMSVTPAENGELCATINFTAPTLTIGGEPLAKINRAVLYRNEETTPAAELPTIDPGESYQITDDDAYNGITTYRLAMCNDSGEGAFAEATAYIGYDAPLPPKDVNVVDNLDGTYTLSWDSDSEGVNGGFVDTSDLTYNVYVYEDYDMVALKKGLSVTTYQTDKIIQAQQNALSFYITAENELGESKYAASPFVVVGNSYTVPFIEGFRNNDMKGIWITEGTVNWGIALGESFDYDNNSLCAQNYSDSSNGKLTSGKITIKNVENPKLAFSAGSQGRADNSITVYAYPNGDKNQMVKLSEVDFSNIGSDSFVWETKVVDLDNFKDSEFINIVLSTQMDDEENYAMLIDDLEIRDVKDHNVELSLSMPNRTIIGEDAVINARVHNIGFNTENDYDIEIIINDKPIERISGKELKPFGYQNVSYVYKPSPIDMEKCHVKVNVVAAHDIDNSDNSGEGMIEVNAPFLNPVENLTSESTKEGIRINWGAPSTDTNITDSFETYEPFRYSGFGEWRTIDRDNKANDPVVASTYPGMDLPGAFFTVDFPSLGYDMTGNEQFLGHTGNAYVACVPNVLHKNDDWLISPKLSGNEQTVRMFVSAQKSIRTTSYRIFYSTSGVEIEDFTALDEASRSAGESYEEIEFTLPEGARYFAIYNNSFFGGMLMIDDVTYEAAARELVGYNVYRNNELIATVDANTLTYSDVKTSGHVSYKVTALYSIGESAPCENAITDSVAIIESIGAGVDAKDGKIYVEGADGCEVSIVALDGKVLFNGTARGTVALPVAKGLYIVTVAGKSAKLLVD